MESEIWPKLWILTRSVNRRTIDQTVISPRYTTACKMTGYQLLCWNFGASHQLNKNTTVVLRQIRVFTKVMKNK
jgi:hypothetical protein